MSIYRGAGGSGDAVNDSSSEATLVAQLAAEAQVDADAAQASATAASNSASTASTQATNAANSATAASTSASNASTSATNSASSASAASTSASNASTSATNASNFATSSSTSASTATTQAGIATTKAGEAATSATNAASSATAAAGSATTASSAADAALAALDSFDDRYLGQKSTAPTVDNDGNALLAGALYFNTTTNEMKVWDGSQWLNAYASLSGALLATSNLSDLNNTATARTNLGVAIGTNVQAYDADLAAIAALAPTADNFIVGNGTTWILETPAQARTSLGATTVGSNLVTLTNPSAVTFPRLNADNTVSALDDSTFRTAIGAGTGNGTVTSVTGTSPVVSSGGNTPAISMPAATGSVNGYLTSTDWTTFNNKGSGTVTSVTGTAPVVSSGGATPAISMAAANTTTNGYLTSTDWNTFNGKQAAGSYVTVGGALGTPSSGTLTNCTFPTLNQNTTGSAGSVANALTAGTGLTSTATYNGSAAITFNATGTTINSQTSGYTLVATDAGKTISITTGGVTIPNAVMTAGNIVSIYNNSGSSQTITQGASLTLQFAGQSSSTTGNRTLGLYGLCTVVFISSSNAVITGSGIT